MANYMKQALSSLGYTLSALRDPAAKAKIRAEAARLEERERKARRSGPTLRQRDVAAALESFEGFAGDPDIYGPEVAEVAAALSESFPGCSYNRISQHLSKLKNAGYIDSSRKLETNGKRGAPPVFYYLTASDSDWSRILSGDLIAKG